jgi:hypothetical protein
MQSLGASTLDHSTAEKSIAVVVVVATVVVTRVEVEVVAAAVVVVVAAADVGTTALLDGVLEAAGESLQAARNPARANAMASALGRLTTAGRRRAKPESC